VGRKAVLPALQRSPTASLVAIASRDLARAQTEAATSGATRAYGSYAELLNDPDVEAVYIPLPNALHAVWAIEAMQAGRHVLCEKPLACTAAEAQRMDAEAEAAGVTLMEAYMTAFHPRTQRALAMAKEGSLGRLLALRSQFTFPNRAPANHRWLPEMGGGALLDVGVYCIEPLLAVAGEPVSVMARQTLSSSGVDATFSGWLEFDGGMTASFLVSFEAPELQRLEIVGTNARLVVEQAFTAGADDRLIDVMYSDGRRESVDAGGCDSYLAMVEHFAAVVRGEAQSLRSPDASVRTLTVLDLLRTAAS
jgi:predicted dehydrogenase